MIKTIVTHSGSFHTDDVFAVATLILVFPDARIQRSRDQSVIDAADVAVDVGRIYDPTSLRFDHHQTGNVGTHDNGIPYASFGLVWKEFGERIAGGREVAAAIEEKLVMPIDAPDNGISICEPRYERVMPYTIGDFIYSYTDYSDKSEAYLHEAFMKGVYIARDLLQREIAKAQERVDALIKMRAVVEAAPDKKIIILDEDLPWEEALVSVAEAVYVIYPRREGNWGVKGVPVALKGFERRKLLPEEWAGLEGENLKRITGIPDAVFCHKDRFLAVADSMNGALALARTALSAH